MKKKFIWTLVVLLASFGAVFLFVWADDLSEYEAEYTQSEMLKQSSQGISTHRDQQAVCSSPLAASSNSAFSRSSAARVTSSPAVVSLSTCVLLC